MASRARSRSDAIHGAKDAMTTATLDLMWGYGAPRRAGRPARWQQRAHGCCTMTSYQRSMSVREQSMATDFSDQLVALLPRLRRFALTLTGDLDRADDLVQQGCEKALLKQDQWQAGTRLDSWMYRMLQNLHIDNLRGQHRRSAHLHEDVVGELVDSDSGALPERENLLGAVAKFIDQLPEDQRTVMLLVAVEEYSYREVSEILDIPVGTVMSRLARARTKIMAMLDAPSAAAKGATVNA